MGNFLKSVTVEPSLFFFIVAFDWMIEIDSNLFLQKACRFNLTTEPDLNTKCDDEQKGILFGSETQSNYGFTISLINMILMILASVWSDAAGRRRRPFIFIALIGVTLNALSGCLHSYFWYWSPSASTLSWLVIQSISGGYHLMMAFSELYICDVTDAESRTMRLGLCLAVRVIARILCKGGFGFILHSIGFFYFYLLCALISLIALVCGVIFIKDTSVRNRNKVQNLRIFTLRRVLLIDSFRVVFNRKVGRKRLNVSLMIFINVAGIVLFHGEMSVLYLYLRYRFKWDERMYGTYLFSKYFSAVFGTLFCSFLLSNRLKLRDEWIGIFASIFDTMSSVGLLLATKTWQLYSVQVMDMFQGVVNTICSSIMSKYYNSDELGQLRAVCHVFMLLEPFCFTIYGSVFQNTLNTFPSSFCLLSIVINVFILCAFIASYYLAKNFVLKKPLSAEEKAMDVPR